MDEWYKNLVRIPYGLVSLEGAKLSTRTGNIIYAEDLEKAVELATQVAEKGTICLMSPAAASYGVFKNFEERGDKFKEYVIKYTSRA